MARPESKSNLKCSKKETTVGLKLIEAQFLTLYQTTIYTDRKKFSKFRTD